MPYQCVGDLLLTFPDSNGVMDYRRDLNLDTAVATVAYAIDGVRYTREVFSSPVDQVIVVRLAADQPGKVAFTAGMKTPQKASVTVESPNTLVMQGVNGGSAGVAGALKFQARVAVTASGGQVVPTDGQITVTGADSAVLLIAAATSYKSFKDVSGDPEALTEETIARAARRSFDAMLKDHVAAHQKLFRRVTLDLGTTPAAQRPTDERIRDPDKENDPQLAALYFQFGRYLLIGSSRPGTQPANLQGLWNESMNPPWQSKYTININTEMNYWPAEPMNLSECVEPLVAMVMDLTETGAHGPDHVQRRRLGHASQYRPVAGLRSDRRSPVGHVADGRRLAVPAPVGPLRLLPRQGVSGQGLSSPEGSGPVLPRYAGRRPQAQMAGDEPVAVTGEPASVRHEHLRGSHDGHADSA